MMHRSSRHPSRRARLLSAAAVATATALAVTGCTAGGGGDDADTLYVLVSETAIGFDPATSVNLPTTWLGLIGRRLTTWEVGDGGTPEVVPDLATDTGTVSDDGLTWSYTLKDDIFFEDGTPITSADIKYGVERTYAPELAGGLAYHKGLLADDAEYVGPYDGAELDSIETPDEKTIVFHLSTPYGDWPWIVSMNPFIPVPADADDPETYGTDPVSSGPYAIESNKDGAETVLVRNEHWDDATDDVRTAGPDKIVFRQGQDLTTTVQSLISDAGDAKNSIESDALGAAQLALVDADPSASERLITSDGGTLTYVAMNVDRPALNDVRVRQAIEYAIDRRSIITAMGGDEAASPATTLIGPGIPGYQEYDMYPAGDSGDVDKATQLLAEAGYPDGLTLELWVANTDEAQAQAVQQGLAKAGITVNINSLDINQMYGDAMGGNPDYDLFLSWWTPDYPSALGTLQLLFDSSMIDGGYNLARYNSPEVDAMIQEAIVESDPDAAAELWSEIDQRIMQDAPLLPLFYSRSSFLAGSNVSNHFVPAYPSFQNYLKITLGS
jgi:peptide/nickel transport system substrate-binding protein